MILDETAINILSCASCIFAACIMCAIVARKYL